VAADAVVVAMGPWSKLAGKWLGFPLDVGGQKYHSAVLHTEEPVRLCVPAAALQHRVRASFE
jgi:glycine/D-amino acid oxidase-like deaminating enzyme